MDYGLSDRVALVTGGSQGIGASTARQLAGEGATVVFTYHCAKDKADAVLGDIQAAGGTAVAVQMDLGDLDSVRAAAATTLERFGRIDILVNNAVFWAPRLPWQAPAFEAEPAEDWRAIFRRNAEAPYELAQAVVPAMRERGWGRIVNVSSGIAVDGLTGSAPYGSAKAALHGLTRTLAKELGPAGILVNVVMPGPTMTERMAAAMPAERRRLRERNTAIGRLLGPDEVAATIVFLCSAANTAVTGELMHASGGYRS